MRVSTNSFANSTTIGGLTACGASLIEVLVAILLIGVSLGAVFKLNNAAVDEMRALKEHHFVQNAMNDFVKKSRLHYTNALQETYTMTGNSTAYPSEDCVKDCSSVESAQYDIKVWTEELQTVVYDLKYDLVVSDEDELQVSVAWGSAAQQPTVNSECPEQLSGNDRSCLVLTAPLGN